MATASGRSSMIRSIVLWIVFIVAVAVVSFFVGYLIGPYVIDHLPSVGG